MASDEALGTYFLMSALAGKAGVPDFLATVYPLRSQIVTFAIIGFHRDRGTWPEGKEDLLAYAKSSPANPPLPEDSLAGLVIEKKEDGGVLYSTTEDRQRGREFTVSKTHRVTFPVPPHPFASPAAEQTPAAKGSTISFDWGEAIAEAITRAMLTKK
jgi:hypothetical protein